MHGARVSITRLLPYVCESFISLRGENRSREYHFIVNEPSLLTAIICILARNHSNRLLSKGEKEINCSRDKRKSLCFNKSKTDVSSFPVITDYHLKWINYLRTFRVVFSPAASAVRRRRLIKGDVSFFFRASTHGCAGCRGENERCVKCVLRIKRARDVQKSAAAETT